MTFKIGDLVMQLVVSGVPLMPDLAARDAYRVEDLWGNCVVVMDDRGHRRALPAFRFKLATPAFKMGDIVTSNDPADLWPFPAMVSDVLPDGRVRLVDPNAPAYSTESLKLANRGPVPLTDIRDVPEGDRLVCLDASSVYRDKRLEEGKLYEFVGPTYAGPNGAARMIVRDLSTGLCDVVFVHRFARAS